MSEEISVVIKVFSILPIILIMMRLAGFFDFFSSNSENKTSNEKESTETDEFSNLIIPDDPSKNFKSGLEIDLHLKKRLQERGIIPTRKNNSP